MTNKEHKQLLVTLNSTLRGIYDGQVTGGGDLWDASPKAKRIGEAIKDLESREPPTLGAIDAVEGIVRRMKGRGDKHFERFDDRVNTLVESGYRLYEAIGESMAYEDFIGGFGEPKELLTKLPEPIRKGYAEGHKKAKEALK